MLDEMESNKIDLDMATFAVLLYRWHLGGGEQRSALPVALALALAGVSSNLRNIQRSKRRNE